MTPEQLAAIVREHTEQAITPLLEVNKALELRILELETRPAVLGPPGVKGDPGPSGAGIASLVISADQRFVAHLTDGRTLDVGPVPRGTDGAKGERGEIGPPGPMGEKGADVDPGAWTAIHHDITTIRADFKVLQATLPDLVAKSLAPPPVIDLDALAVKAAALVPPPVHGRDGKDADPTFIEQLVAKAVQALPPPTPGLNGKDGTSITVADVAPLITSEVQKAVSAIPAPASGLNGKDGIGVMDAVLDRAGHLILTLSDGRTKDVGLITGRDADPLEMKRLILEEVAKIPPPKDGRDGKDGADGMTLDDADLLTDEAGWILRLSAGGRTKDFRLPVPHHQGPWAAGKTYLAGAAVSWDGSWWIAKAESSDQPGSSDAWQLVVRRGKTGKEGPRGKDGRDLTPSNTPPLY